MLGTQHMYGRRLCYARMRLQAELKLLGITNVGIHNLSPGMVTTELLMAGEHARSHKILQASLPDLLMTRLLYLMTAFGTRMLTPDANAISEVRVVKVIAASLEVHACRRRHLDSQVLHQLSSRAPRGGRAVSGAKDTQGPPGDALNWRRHWSGTLPSYPSFCKLLASVSFICKEVWLT